MPRSRFTSSVLKYAVESEPIVFPISFGPVQLNKTVKSLLKDNGIDTKNVKFNFFINGEVIDCPLKDFLELKGISEEIEEIVYDIDIKPPNLENETKFEEQVYGMKFKSKWLLCATGDLEIIDSTSPVKPVVSISCDVDMLQVEWLSFDEDSNEAVIIAGGIKGYMYSWKCDLKNRTVTQQFSYKGHTNDISRIAVSTSRGLIASGCSDGMLKIWSTSQELTDLSAETGGIPHVPKNKDPKKIPIRIPLLTLLAHSESLKCIKWLDPEMDAANVVIDSSVKSTSGNLMTIGNDITLWHINGFESTVLRRITLPCKFMVMDHNQHTQLILIGCSDTRLRCFDFREAKHEVNTINGAHDKGINVVKWNPINPNMFVTCSYDGATKLWDARNIKSARAIVHKSTEAIRCCDWSHDGELLAVSYTDGSLKFFRFD